MEMKKAADQRLFIWVSIDYFTSQVTLSVEVSIA